MNTRLTLAEPRTLSADANILELVDDWKAALTLQVSAGEMAETTRRTYEVGLDKFVTWARKRDHVNDDLALEWIAELRVKGNKPASVNTWLAGVRAFFRWALTSHRLAYDPLAGLRGVKRKGSQKHSRQPLTDRETLRVLGAPSTETEVGKRDRCILALMAYCGLRTVEIHRANVEDLTTEHGHLVLNVQGKGKDEADDLVVVAHPDAQDALHAYLAIRGDAPGALFVSFGNRSHGKRLSLSAIRDLVKEYYRLAGVHGKGKTTHSLRHTALSSAVAHGAPVHKVQAMARHANLATTGIYVHEIERLTDPAEGYVSYTGAPAQGMAL